LAAGGMGAVFEAEDLRGGRVAVKVLHPDLARDLEIHRRFRREAAVLEVVRHPGVVRVHDVGGEGDLVFIVMELLEGETLYAHLQRRSTLTPGELVPIVRDVCAALEEVHGRGILHGDLKPPNVFLVDPKREATCVKVVDFGLSKVHGLERLTRTGEVLGTPAYMAPELLTGEGTLDRRIDLYSLGVVLFEAMAGRLPFEERNPGRLLFRIAEGDTPDLQALRPDLSVALTGLVRRAMAARPADRYPDANALARAFAEAAHGE
jgi:eukaryotic-like serine/threonine-protein kinase